MNINNILKIVIIFVIVLIGFSISYYFLIFLPKNNQLEKIIETNKIDIAKKTLSCYELYELKKSRYWNKTGNDRVIYNTEFDTCLALNIYNDIEDKRILCNDYRYV